MIDKNQQVRCRLNQTLLA